MLAYAASRRVVARRDSSPHSMLLIVGAHIALVAAVMSARMEVQRHRTDPPLVVDTIRDPTPPPPNVHPTRPIVQQPIRNILTTPIRPLVTPSLDNPTALRPQTVGPGPIVGGGATITPEISRPVTTPTSSGPELITSESELRPPYPASKLLNEEEAVLTLKLTINEQGRVVSVDPVGRADSVFLDAARRHLIAHWRFRPASEGGRAVTSTKVIALRFELDA